MRFLRIIGITAAILMHAGFILFGGLLFHSSGKKEKKVQQVELVSAGELNAEEKKKEEKKKEDKKPQEPEEEVKAQEEAPPESADLVAQSAEASSASLEPALEAASLGAIEAALSGAGGDQSFGGTLSFASGGRIGGTGRAGQGPTGAGDQSQAETAFSMADIDQKPRVIYQVAPTYPSELRAKKAQGEVWLLLVVDVRGRVSNVRVEKSSHSAFAKPAVDAVKQWKFDPALRGGQKVACRMRVPIRFTLG
jgi:protein TonB